MTQITKISKFAFPTAQAYVQGMLRQDSNCYSDDYFYFRGGSAHLTECETNIATLAGIEEGRLILTTSGMSAVTTALDIAALTADDVIVHGITQYGQIHDYISLDLQERRVQPVAVNAGDIDAIDKKLISLAIKKVKIIFLETVGNGPDMNVLDIKKFLSLPILKKLDPLIILDNTLLTDSVIQLASLIKNSPLRIIGLESATKFYLLNQDLGGILYTYNDSLLQQLMKRRKRLGATPGPSLIKAFKALTPHSKEYFNKTNRTIMRNTRFLADACSKAAGAEKKFRVRYPNIQTHPNYLLSNRYAPDGIAPVFFITPATTNSTAEEMFYRLDKVEAFEKILITESFGFMKTAVSHCTRYGGFIRIAGGLESPGQIRELGKQLQIALSLL